MTVYGKKPTHSRTGLFVSLFVLLCFIEKFPGQDCAAHLSPVTNPEVYVSHTGEDADVCRCLAMFLGHPLQLWH